ncbi:MAG: cupin domain-containing protein [Bacteroidota bacterium]
MSKKSPHVIESGESNGGTRTVIRTVFHAGASVQPHFHTEFEETFRLTGGEMLLELEGKQLVLTAGESIKIPRNAVHSFIVLSLAVAEIILEPAHENFEQALDILAGTAKDDLFQPGLLDDMNLVQMAVIAGLTNSNYVGDTGQMLQDFYNKTGEMVEEVKAEWIKKYGKIPHK